MVIGDAAVVGPQLAASGFDAETVKAKPELPGPGR